MDKSLLVFVAIGLGALYLLTNFIGEIQEEDDAYKSNEYKVAHKYDKYQREDSIGQPILVFDSNVDIKTQEAAWHASKIKQEFLEIFPDYTDMKKFVKERTRIGALQSKLLNMIVTVEGKFFSGSVDAEQAKQMLDSLK